jgi:hypothetical protein
MLNCQEVGKDKWLCPFSGKKYKGPEFFSKHILNEYRDKIDEVRKEVKFDFLFRKKRKDVCLPDLF